MKKKAPNYLTKVSNNQIKTVVERKKHIATEALCKKAMQELNNIYWYEKELLIAIPMLIEDATTSELMESLTLLITCTSEHLKLLEKQFPQNNQVPILKETYNPNSLENVVCPGITQH